MSKFDTVDLRIVASSFALFLTCSCGGTIQDGPALGDGGTDASEAQADTGDSEMSEHADAGGWTQCSSPDGLMVCGGPNDCNPTNTVCACTSSQAGPSRDVADCQTGAPADNFYGMECVACSSDRLCVNLDDKCCPNDFNCAPSTLGQLFAMNGGTSRVLFTDFSSYSDDPIPQPGTCPPLEGGATLCAGSCGSCSASTDACTGQSPLHPFGFCAIQFATCGPDASACSTGQGCFMFTVQPDAQARASVNGYCMPQAECSALAGGLPGGGTCVMH